MALDKIPTNADLDRFKPDSLKQVVREWFDLCADFHQPRSDFLEALKKISNENLVKLHQSGLLKAFLKNHGKSLDPTDPAQLHPLAELEHALRCDVAAGEFSHIEKVLAFLHLSYQHDIKNKDDANCSWFLADAEVSSTTTSEERKTKMGELFERRLALVKPKEPKLNLVNMSNIVEHVKGILGVKRIENPAPKKKKPVAVFEFDAKKLKQIEDFFKKDEYKDKYSFGGVTGKVDEYVISKVKAEADGSVKKTDVFNVDAKQGKITLPQDREATVEDYQVVLLALMESLKNAKKPKIVMWAVNKEENQKIQEAMENIFEEDEVLEKKFGEYHVTSDKSEYAKLKSGDPSLWKKQPERVVEVEEDEEEDEEENAEKKTNFKK